MKFSVQKIAVFLSALFLAGNLWAQSPHKFNYQGIARDAKGNPLSRQTMSLKLSVVAQPDAGVPEYEEVQTVTTNEFGLYTLQIGGGQAVSGDMKNVTWETGSKYIRVAIDPAGGTDFSEAGTTQLLSVPYALYADRAGSAKSGSDRTGTVSSNAAHVAGDANYLSKFTALNVIGKSQIFDNGTTVGIGTATPVATASMHVRRTTGGQYLYMENPTANSFGSFRMYNDVPANFATFTKYGSGVTGGYTGIASLYPFANILGYGNNGPFLNAGTGNIGFAITKGGTNKLKIHIDAASERVGIGGNAVPAANVHLNNTDGTGDTLKLTNNTSGHTAGDGLDIIMGGTAARIINKENDALTFGTNNLERARITNSGNFGIGTSSPLARLMVLGAANADTALVASTVSGSLQQTGILGTYNQAGFGAGVVGMAFGGQPIPSIKDIGVYGSSIDIAVWSQGKLKVVDGTQGAGKVLESDAEGTASWKDHIYSSPWLTASVDLSDTLIDGTCVRARYLSAPQINSAVLDSAMITVYFKNGSIGPYQLPYISDAGGGTNQIACGFTVGKIVITRHTFDNCRYNSGFPQDYPGQPVMVDLPQSMLYRYVIHYNH